MASKRERAQWARKLSSGNLSGSNVAPTLVIKAPFSGVVLGIDPSLRSMGMAVLQFEDGKASYINSVTQKNSKQLSQAECLGKISWLCQEWIETYKPEVVAVEETIYVQNFRTAQIMGASRGAAVGVVSAAQIPVFEYPPLRIKQAVTGFGRASKEQMSSQVRALLKLEEPLGFDEADAAAVAICHVYSGSGVTSV